MTIQEELRDYLSEYDSPESLSGILITKAADEIDRLTALAKEREAKFRKADDELAQSRSHCQGQSDENKRLTAEIDRLTAELKHVEEIALALQNDDNAIRDESRLEKQKSKFIAALREGRVAASDEPSAKLAHFKCGFHTGHALAEAQYKEKIASLEKKIADAHEAIESWKAKWKHDHDVLDRRVLELNTRIAEPRLINGWLPGTHDLGQCPDTLHKIRIVDGKKFFSILGENDDWVHRPESGSRDKYDKWADAHKPDGAYKEPEQSQLYVKRPATIEELENILKESSDPLKVMPDGSCVPVHGGIASSALPSAEAQAAGSPEKPRYPHPDTDASG